MKTCVKCGEKIRNSEAIAWDWCLGAGQRYICPECYAEENDYYEEDEEQENNERNNIP